MSDGLKNRTIAFGGLLQCVHLVSTLAWEGRCNEAAFDTCIDSVLLLDPKTYPDVYNGIAGIELGLKRLLTLLVDKYSRSGHQAVEEVRYSLALMELSKRMTRNTAMLNHIQQELISINGQRELGRKFIVDQIGALYRATISTMNPRVIVHGEPEFLNDDYLAVRIRALLFAGIRAVSLWRQADGNRIKMLWERRAMLEACRQLLANI